MRTIGKAHGIKLYIPDDAFFSFFNSPYIGHKNQSSVDVYPAHLEWGGPAYSPINGKVVKIRQVKMGKEREFDTDPFDYAIGIQSGNMEKSIVRILHCQPSVEVGDNIEVGDDIGSLLRSRYFNFWTNPHFHVEVTSSVMFHRSSKSFPIENALGDTTSLSIEGSKFLSQSVWTVQTITPDYMLVTSPSSFRGRIDTVYGHVANVASMSRGLLDAGIPHYPHGGVFGARTKSGSVSLGDSLIGFLEQHPHYHSYFKQNKECTVYVDDIQVRGLSTYLYSSAQLISGLIPLKIVPKLYNSFSKSWNEGDSIRLSLRQLE
ncbi:MAG: hypothetical protein ACXAEF_04475 [Candidatus Thorarchaeota archaeon]